MVPLPPTTTAPGPSTGIPGWRSPPRRNPDVPFSLHDHTGSTGCESRFTGRHSGQRCRRNGLPALPPIGRGQDKPASVDRVAKHDTVLFVPEGDTVEKHALLLRLVQQCPCFPAIGRFIEPGLPLLGGTGAHQDSGLRVKGFYVPEVTGLCVGYGSCLPGLPTISTADICAFGAANPDDVRTSHIDRAKAGVGVYRLWLPLCVSGASKTAINQKYNQVFCHKKSPPTLAAFVGGLKDNGKNGFTAY